MCARQHQHTYFKRRRRLVITIFTVLVSNRLSLSRGENVDRILQPACANQHHGRLRVRVSLPTNQTKRNDDRLRFHTHRRCAGRQQTNKLDQAARTILSLVSAKRQSEQ